MKFVNLLLINYNNKINNNHTDKIFQTMIQSIINTFHAWDNNERPGDGNT